MKLRHKLPTKKKLKPFLPLKTTITPSRESIRMTRDDYRIKCKSYPRKVKTDTQKAQYLWREWKMGNIQTEVLIEFGKDLKPKARKYLEEKLSEKL